MTTNRYAQFLLVAAAIAGALGVAAGAFGAHALRGALETRLFEVFETAARYQMMHALALGLVGALLLFGGDRLNARWLRLSGGLFLAGLLIFCGTLYILSLSGVRWLGAITPLGGLAFIAAWIACAIGVWPARRS